jgi:hypothetical protein
MAKLILKRSCLVLFGIVAAAWAPVFRAAFPGSIWRRSPNIIGDTHPSMGVCEGC